MTMTDYQNKVKLWTNKCFGESVASNVIERNYRFLEEALELIQAGGMPKDVVTAMVNHVFDRPIGDINQEVGGAIVTLASFCNARDLSLEIAANEELNRIEANLDKIREKHQTKTLRIK